MFERTEALIEAFELRDQAARWLDEIGDELPKVRRYPYFRNSFRNHFSALAWNLRVYSSAVMNDFVRGLP